MYLQIFAIYLNRKLPKDVASNTATLNILQVFFEVFFLSLVSINNLIIIKILKKVALAVVNWLFFAIIFRKTVIVLYM